MINYFEWNKSLEIGHDLIDQQHRNLIQLFNCAYCASKQNVTVDIVVDLLEELLKYCDEHFSTEEKLMKIHNFNEYDEHCAEHRMFGAKVLYFIKKMNIEDNMNLINEIAIFIKSWILHHISTVDIKLRDLV